MGIKSRSTELSKSHDFSVKNKDITIEIEMLLEESFYPFEERSEEIRRIDISCGEKSQEIDSDFFNYTEVIDDFIVSLFNDKEIPKKEFLKENPDIDDGIEKIILSIEEEYQDFI